MPGQGLLLKLRAVCVGWGGRFDEGFRADIIVESKVILELKSVERITNAHKKQLLTYLKLTGMKLGYLLNFGEDMMKRGITRTVNTRIKEPWRSWRLCERKRNSNKSLQRTEYRR